jgi:hypothetical protein
MILRTVNNQLQRHTEQQPEGLQSVLVPDIFLCLKFLEFIGLNIISLRNKKESHSSRFHSGIAQSHNY